MFEDYVPKRKIGDLAPLAVIDNHPYEFYQLVPSGVMLLMVPLGLQAFTAEDVERVFKPIDEQHPPAEFSAELGVPVLDALATSIQTAEMMVRMGAAHSIKTYPREGADLGCDRSYVEADRRTQRDRHYRDQSFALQGSGTAVRCRGCGVGQTELKNSQRQIHFGGSPYAHHVS